MLQSALTCADDPATIEIVAYVDDDDTGYDQRNWDHRVRLVRGSRIVLSEMWNRCYEQAHGDILMHCGDDIVFHTHGWDRLVTAAFAAIPDRLVFVFGDDGGPRGTTFGTHGFVSREWVETLGYMVPPYFSSDYNDTWLNEIADTVGRRRFVPILTRHMHPDWGLGEWDETHLEREARHRADRVDELYASLAPERARDAQKLAGRIATAENPVTTTGRMVG